MIIYGYFVMICYVLVIFGSIALLIGGSQTGYLNFNKTLIEDYNRALAHREINR